MPKVIITGATGYVGSHLTRTLLSNNWEIGIISQKEFGYENIKDVITKVQICEYDGEIENLISFFKTFKPDVVMHLAAAIVKIPSPQQIKEIIDSNVLFGTEILEAMRISGSRLFIGTGTYWQNYNSNEYNPVNLYAASKEAFEKILKYYVEAHNFRAIILRLYDIYGEDDRRPKIWNLLKTSKPNHDPIKLTLGEQQIYLVHIEDVVKAYQKAYEWFLLNQDFNFEIFGVYGHIKKHLRDLVEEYSQSINQEFNLEWGAKSYNEREIMSPNTPYMRVPGWTCKNLFFE